MTLPEFLGPVILGFLILMPLCIWRWSRKTIWDRSLFLCAGFCALVIGFIFLAFFHTAASRILGKAETHSLPEILERMWNIDGFGVLASLAGVLLAFKLFAKAIPWPTSRTRKKSPE